MTRTHTRRLHSKGENYSDVITIANLLNLPEKDESDHNQIVAAVQSWLKNHFHWLLIFDNFEDIALLNDFLPTAYHGHVLLTTRAHALGTVAHRVNLEKMQAEEGALLLLRRAGILTIDDSLEHAASDTCDKVMELSLLMNGLPLALDQAGAYAEPGRVLFMGACAVRGCGMVL